jgi:hypothetical protein
MSTQYGEPWQVHNEDDPPDIRVSAKVMGNIVCEAPTMFDLSMSAWPERSARMIACVNALAGITSETLESAAFLEAIGPFREAKPS